MKKVTRLFTIFDYHNIVSRYCFSIQVPDQVRSLRILISFHSRSQRRASKNVFPALTFQTRHSQVLAHKDGYMGWLRMMSKMISFMAYSIDNRADSLL